MAAEGGEAGGYDPQMEDLTRRLEELKARDNDETYEDREQDRDYNDDNTTYNTGANLQTNDTFDTYVRQRDPDLETITTKNEIVSEKLENAIKPSGRKYTKLGLDLLSNKVVATEENELYLKWKGEELKITDDRGKLLTYTKIQEKYGEAVRKYIENTIKTKGTNIEMRPMDNEASRFQLPELPPESQIATTSFIENLDPSPEKLTKNFADFTDEDFEKVGFSEHHIGEIKGIFKFIDDALTIQTQKDMKIGELEVKLDDLNKDIIKSLEDNIDLNEQLIKEKQDLLDKINEEKGGNGK